MPAGAGGTPGGTPALPGAGSAARCLSHGFGSFATRAWNRAKTAWPQREPPSFAAVPTHPFLRNLPPPPMTRLLRVLLLTSAVLGMLTLAGSAAEPPRPNILFIIFDDWGPSSQAGINGCDWIKTPNFDRVA